MRRGGGAGSGAHHPLLDSLGAPCGRCRRPPSGRRRRGTARRRRSTGRGAPRKGAPRAGTAAPASPTRSAPVLRCDKAAAQARGGQQVGAGWSRRGKRGRLKRRVRVGEDGRSQPVCPTKS